MFETSSDEEASLRKACVIEEDNGYKAHEFEEIATTNNDLEVDVAMDNTFETGDGKCIETSSPLFQENWAMVNGNMLGFRSLRMGCPEPA